MNRRLLNDLIAWKESGNRKPLILRGARQVGKTWLMKEFGRLHYQRVAYVNFEQNPRIHSLFDEGLELGRILTGLQAELGFQIEAENTLVVFDEIQAVPSALTALKYFSEDARQYHIIAAGSMLGVAIHSGISFPVGKVSFIDLYPLDFHEFLEALGEKQLVNLLDSGDWPLIQVFRSKYQYLLKLYYFVGGMPEAVQAFSNNSNFREVREIQKNILNTYDQDFSKHAPVSVVPRIRMAFSAIPSQLAKENRKFIYGLIRQGARAREYELALAWLEDCGQIYKVNRVTRPGYPLKAYLDQSAFKIFLADTGLLSAMGDIHEETLLEGNEVFTEFKGALTEQFVLQQLKSMPGMMTTYWSADRSTAEVDFVVQFENSVVPIEVKAEENLQAKSLKLYHQKFNPPLSVRTSLSDYRKEDWMVNLPLWAIGILRKILV